MPKSNTFQILKAKQMNIQTQSSIRGFLIGANHEEMVKDGRKLIVKFCPLTEGPLGLIDNIAMSFTV